MALRCQTMPEGFLIRKEDSFIRMRARVEDNVMVFRLGSRLAALPRATILGLVEQVAGVAADSGSI